VRAEAVGLDVLQHGVAKGVLDKGARANPVPLAEDEPPVVRALADVRPVVPG